MLAAECNQVRDAAGLLLDQCQAGSKIAEGNTEVAHIGKGQRGRIGPQRRMRTIHQHAAGLADGTRPIARSRTIGGAKVKRDARNDDTRGGVLSGDPEEARSNSEGRRVRHHRLLRHNYAA